MNNKITSALFGLGNIGLKYDLNNSESTIKTHSKALANFEHFDFKFAIDPIILNREMFAKQYSVKSYENLEFLSNKETRVDLAVVATPTKTRLNDLKSIIETLQPKYLILEKPIASNKVESNQIVQLLEENNIKTLVNYHRRFLPGTDILKTHIKNNTYGELKNISCNYNRGLINCGSHFIDLIFYLTDSDYHNLNVLNKIENDNYQNYSFTFQIHSINILFNAISQDYFNVGDLNFYFENATIKVTNHSNHIEINDLKQNNISNIEFGSENFVYYTYNHLIKSITTNTDFASNLTTAQHTLSFCQEIIDEYQ